MGCHSSSYACEGRRANTFGNIVYFCINQAISFHLSALTFCLATKRSAEDIEPDMLTYHSFLRNIQGADISCVREKINKTASASVVDVLSLK